MDDQNNNNRRKEEKNQSKRHKKKQKDLGSTTSLGKRRRMDKKAASTMRRNSPGQSDEDFSKQQQPNNQQSPQQSQSDHQNQHHHHQHQHHHNNQRDHRDQQQQHHQGSSSTMSEPRTSEYGSQATLLRVPLRKPDEKPIKVTIVGAAGGIGQPLSLLLMLHSEYIQHLALYDLAHVRGVGADLSHVDRQCKLTTHLGQEELADAVRDANVIIILAGIAQKPGMSRDDLFGTNAKIMFDIAKVCAINAPEAHLAIVSNPVNSLVPIVNHVYQKYGPKQQQLNVDSINGTNNNTNNNNINSPIVQDAIGSGGKKSLESQSPQRPIGRDMSSQSPIVTDDLPAWCRRIFGVTTLDVVRASTLLAKSPFYTSNSQANDGLFKDPSKITVPVVGGHAGKTILPLLSRATPPIDKDKLTNNMKLTCKVIESIQEAGIDVLNAKKGAGSATLAMAYSACRFTISLLRAQLGESNIVECAYVRHPKPIFDNLDYFALPLVLGKQGWVKTVSPLGKILPFEHQMAEEAAKLLRASVARGEDFAKEHLSFEKN